MLLVTGARGVVGLPLCRKLSEAGLEYRTVSRTSSADIVWDMHQSASKTTIAAIGSANTLIHSAPIWLLPAHLDTIHAAGIRRLIVFSSTSVLSKQQSQNQQEQTLVRQLADAETELLAFCESKKMQLTILRPSMIYGYGRDENITRIASFIHRFGFAILGGKAVGLRQPVHADDLADVVVTLLSQTAAEDRVFNLAGAEVLSYRQMVERIFAALGKKPRIFHIPVPMLRFFLYCIALFTRFEYTSAMADRMNQDLAYDNTAAYRAFAYTPQKFLQHPERDLPTMVKPV